MMSSAPTSPFPPLAGLCPWPDAFRDALGVEECVSWLKRLHYVFKRLHEVLIVRLTSEPQYELKTALSLHAYWCAEHTQALRTRVGEMREPPLGLDVVPHAALERCFDEIRATPGTEELVVGLYGVVFPALAAAIDEYLVTTNPLADAPSVRVLRFARLEIADAITFGDGAVRAVTTPENRMALDEWRTYLVAWLNAAGGVSGRTTETVPPAPRYSAKPWAFDRVPKRDARFHDPYNAGVNPEAFLHDTRFSASDKLLMLSYKRLREIDVPEMMASILAETKGRPWEFSLDMTRQLWDEARHAMLGEVGFAKLGVDWSQIPINFTWSLNLNTQLNARERHAVLFFIEQGLMPRQGKRYEWEVAQESGVPLAAVFQDFDWADEVLHAHLGRKWYVKEFKDLKEALAYGDACWSRVMSHWRAYRDQGLTGHHNWWPEVYRAACRTWGAEPDPVALSFAETYEAKRADLQPIAAE
jgi:hypothetical protein